MYTTAELISVALTDPTARQALFEARQGDLEARMTEDHIALALAICDRNARESSARAGTINPLFGEPEPDRSKEWADAADSLYWFAARLGIRPPADYP